MGTKTYVTGGLFIAIVTAMTFINLPINPAGGLVHLGYVALFPIAAVFGKKYGFVAGAVGMALFDVLGQWFLWAPATFVIAGAVGYIVGSFSKGGSSWKRNVTGMLIASAVQIVGYFVYNAFILGFGVESAIVSIMGDSFKMLVSTGLALLVIPAVQRVKNTLVVG